MFRPVLKKVASGTREVGDGTVLVGETGLAIQSKSREGSPADEDRERRWLTKNINAALAQAAGTIRSLRREPSELENARGRLVEADGSAYRWLVVVVIDHPSPPLDFTVDFGTANYPSVVLLRRDWEFLFEQLKSTHAVAAYLWRVANEPIELGEEPARYFELALADQEAPAEKLEPHFDQPGGTHISTPILPIERYSEKREPAQLVFRALLEDIAAAGRSDGPETSRLMMLSELDRFPVARRGEIGQFLLDALNETAGQEDAIAWRIRRVSFGHAGAHLGFGVCSAVHTENIQAAWRIWVELRHYERLQVTNEGELLTTVGVLLTPGTNGRPVDTTAIAVRGEIHLTEEDLAAYRAVWAANTFSDPDPNSCG